MTVPCSLADSTIYRENARHSARFYALRAASGADGSRPIPTLLPEKGLFNKMMCPRGGHTTFIIYYLFFIICIFRLICIFEIYHFISYRGQKRHPARAGVVFCGKGQNTVSHIIEVQNLTYVYNPGMPDAVTALDAISFSVEEGDFVGIIGSTGSGKSTLISHFNGINRPTSGKVLVDGKDMWQQGADLRSFRFMVGLVMQYPEYQLFEETCAKDIAYGPRNMGLSEAEIEQRVREAAAFVGLSEELLQKSPFELSGGQKRRVAIAGVMAMRPRVLVLDEPAAGLDPEGRDTILSQIREYHEKTGITVLLVSHSMEDIAKYANRVLVLNHAGIAMYDTVENVFARAQELLELGLSVPQVTQIFLRLRQMGLDIHTDVYTIPYAVKTIRKALAAKQGGAQDA